MEKKMGKKLGASKIL